MLNLVGNILIFARPLWNRYNDLRLLKNFEVHFEDKRAKKLTAAERINREIEFRRYAAEGSKANTRVVKNPLGTDDSGVDPTAMDETGDGGRVDHKADPKARPDHYLQALKVNHTALNFLIEEETGETDTQDRLPNVNKFTHYVPWKYVETYSDYLR
jgi:hypothetical protein